jgi:hypothetical protein
MLASHPALTCHRYSDFPNVWTPYWRNYLLQKTRREPPQPRERAHRDRILISQNSPEAVEEVLWMHFFEGLHDPAQCNVLDQRNRNLQFDRFYSDHIRKLLAVREAPRYLAKGNYNISRLAYLHRLFPGARFLIPVREPEYHIASLAKQHGLFERAHALDPRVGRQLAMSGHFEFGPHRRQVNFGDAQGVQLIEAAWGDGREVEGWARYWAATYSFLADQLDAMPDLSGRCLFFRYEDLCSKSEAVIDAILEHCNLDPAPFTNARALYAELLTLPSYYRPAFTDGEAEQIDQHCSEVYRRSSAHCFQT